jgi:hypothetical protein
MSADDSGPKLGDESPALSLCARCGAEFRCGAQTGSCWCETVEVPLATSQRLREAYADCLCASCLAAEVKREEYGDGC